MTLERMDPTPKNQTVTVQDTKYFFQHIDASGPQENQLYNAVSAYAIKLRKRLKLLER